MPLQLNKGERNYIADSSEGVTPVDVLAELSCQAICL